MASNDFFNYIQYIKYEDAKVYTRAMHRVCTPTVHFIYKSYISFLYRFWTNQVAINLH